mmetsp:Transcript_53157/g.170317  ORF Transcript_53157/g.170317 Transcript_53157/m.170317 type:complete len:229 (-) Transcript_53157:347-1033(-)
MLLREPRLLEGLLQALQCPESGESLCGTLRARSAVAKVAKLSLDAVATVPQGAVGDARPFSIACGQRSRGGLLRLLLQALEDLATLRQDRVSFLASCQTGLRKPAEADQLRVQLRGRGWPHASILGRPPGACPQSRLHLPLARPESHGQASAGQEFRRRQGPRKGFVGGLRVQGLPLPHLPPALGGLAAHAAERAGIHSSILQRLHGASTVSVLHRCWRDARCKCGKR